MAHQAHTPFELFTENTLDTITRFFKRAGLHIVDVGESIGSARAASELASLGRYEAARAVIDNYSQCSEARQRLIRQLK